MRLWIIAFTGIVVLAAILAGYLLFALPPAQLPSLVPDDAAFVFTATSINDLRDAYHSRYERSDFDPARQLVGEKINAPGLDGLSYDKPLAVYVTKGGEEVSVMPFRDFGAYRDAYEKSREDIHLRAPHKVAANYFSVSRSDKTAHVGSPDPLVRSALDTPLGFVLRPEPGKLARDYLPLLLFPYLFGGGESRALLADLGEPIGRVGNWIGESVEGVVLGVTPRPSPTAAAVLGGPVALRHDGPLAAAAALPDDLDPASLARNFPVQSLLFACGRLDSPTWRSLHLGIDPGPAVAGIAVVRPMMVHPRPFVLLVEIRPKDSKKVPPLVSWAKQGFRAAGSSPLEFHVTKDDDAEVSTAELAAPAPFLHRLLAASSDKPPPVYLSTAVYRGIFFLAVGSQAQLTVSRALTCVRGRRQLSLEASLPVSAHRGFLEPGHLALALATEQGMRAVGGTLPSFRVASIGHPVSATAVLDDERLEIHLLPQQASRRPLPPSGG